MNYFKHTTLLCMSVLGTLLISNVFDSTVLAQDPVVNVGGEETGIFDWSEAVSVDPNGWNNGTSQGNRDDLYRVYYHQPSEKYIKVSVSAQFRWNGGTNDDHPYAPKIINEAKNGMGGFNQTEMFLFNSQVRKGTSTNNSLTIEFFEDANLTQKASVNNLNFTLTDLDSGRETIDGIQITGREKVVVNAVGVSGEDIPVEFYQPEGSLIESSWINGGSVLGYEKGTNTALGNIAPILTGETHRIEISYLVEVSPANDAYNNTRNMYISDLAWGGYTVKVTPDEEVILPELPPEEPPIPTTPSEEPQPNNAPTPADDYISSFAWKNSVIDVIENDTDPDNQDEVLIITQINGNSIEIGKEVNVAGGKVTVNSNNKIEYNSNNIPGNYTFEYSVSDSQGASGSATVTISLEGYAD